MSEETNQWRKRTTIALTCPSSGIKIIVRRPGPDLALKAARLPRVLQSQDPAKMNPATQLEIIEKLPDDELNKVMAFARILIADVVIDPVLSLHPKEGQLSPDDVPLLDFWWIFGQAMAGFPSEPVKLTEGETDIETVRTFPSGEVTSAPAGEDRELIQ